MAQPTNLQIALTFFQARVAALALPSEPAYRASAPDLDEFAMHLAEAGAAFVTYVQAVRDNCADVAPTAIADATAGLEDAISELVGEVRRASDRIEEAA